MIHITNCPVCGNQTFQTLFTCKDYTVTKENFDLIKCEQCEFVITSPRPTNTELGRYYLSDDYISHSNKPKTLIDRVYLTARNYTLSWKLRLISKYTKRTHNKLLDYGCGTGAFLQATTQDNWKSFGIEPSPEAREIAKTVTNSPVYESLDEIDNISFDAITLWHVLEHVPDLNSLIQKLKSLLANDGTMFIAVPNHLSWEGKHYKALWAGYDVPRHLWHFTDQAMKKLVENNGLKLTDIVPMKLDSFYISLLSEKYKKGDTTITGMFTAFINGLKSNILAAKSGQYSSLIYIVKK
jgi:2-polyprenyl-3-methyl-5-hydroxy-6-metoxy-1,4-benzoquinol methylase